MLRDALAAAQAISDDGRRAFARAALVPDEPETLLPKLDMELHGKAARTRRPTRCCSTRALVGDSSLFIRQDSGRIMQALLDVRPLPTATHRDHGAAKGHRPTRGGPRSLAVSWVTA